MNFAGFWIRVLAYIIDIIPLLIIGFVLALLSGEDLINTDPSAPIYSFTDLIGLIVGIAYFVGFESSAYQATPGKMALGLIVVDTDGRRISPARAFGRYFAKILSGLILLIGYIMVGFTERKQGLHDMIAGTLVVYGKPGQVGYDPDVFD
ncbi:RDD family protein [Porphyrobacter sp. ULC335]|uniref:RDD family protein n=1 Tax=Porphyrobacter sp. ULC335 TaxID=2854260 RepID=UPI00221F3816|nr:RDD family protein [Porphyrobacter sp. ULC335]UYV15328.1 RDD family protein [Porphyrobacter sp. ULC335]